MASASQLKKNMKVQISEGPFAGREAIVLDPEVRPDNTENQRKVLIAIPDLEIEEEWILPRQLSLPQPIGSFAPPKPTWTELQVNDIPKEFRNMPVDTAAIRRVTDPMDPTLDRFRPRLSDIAEYVDRVLPGGFKAIDLLLDIREDRDSNGYSGNVALKGDTQSGKTLFTGALAAAMAKRDGMPKPYPRFTLAGSIGITAYEMNGLTVPVIQGGQEVLVQMTGIVPLAAMAGGLGYYDELNAIATNAAVGLHPVLDHRHEFINYHNAVPDGYGGWMPEVITVSPNLFNIATINPGYKGTTTMGEALTNRFQWIEWGYDKDVEELLVPSSTIRIIGDSLRNTRAMGALSTPIGTSALQTLNRNCARYGVDYATWSFITMFGERDQDKVREIISSRGLVDLLRTEYPDQTRKFMPVEAEEATPEPASDDFSTFILNSEQEQE